MRKTTRVRVYDLVKKLGLPKEEVLKVLRELSVGVRSTLSTVDESVAQTVELRLKQKAKKPKLRKKKEEKKEVPARLRPRLVRKADATGKAREMIRDVLEKEEEERERERLAAEAVAAAAEAEPQPSPEPAAKPETAVPTRPKPAAGRPARRQAEPPKARPGPPPTRTPSIPPPSAPKRPAITTRLRTSRPTAVAAPHKRPFRLQPVATHPVQKSPSARRKPARPEVETPAAPVEPGQLGEVTLTEGVTVKELAEKTGRGSRDFIQLLMRRGILATINQTLERDLAVNLCEELGYTAKIISFEQEAVQQAEQADAGASHHPRDPVVTVMGHVDHGKTSLLDAIRRTNVVSREHGGITQHIGAYHVTHKKRGITFLDTPGHEAFTRMRSRGARITDIVVLVVAADDGVMPQTVEAIDHARAAGVPMVIALNKIDKPDSQPDKVKKALADQGVLIEEYGGESVCIPVSAKKRTGIEELLDMVLLVADMGELQSNPERHASGTVIEARLDRTRGAVATVLIQNGTLKVGDPFIAGAAHGKVRAMFDEHRKSLRSAGPSRPVEILGMQGVPRAGDIFQVLSDEAKARRIGELRQIRQREEGLRKSSRLNLATLHQQIQEGEVKDLPLILKGDVQGSVEALSQRLNDLSDDRVKVKILHSATGPVTENDVLLATASNAIIIGFNVRPEPKAVELADSESVEIRLNNVIYEVEDEIKKAMLGLLEPEEREVYLGRAEIRQVFRIKKIGTVVGCQVLDGLIKRNSEVRIHRGEEVLFEGRVGSLRRFKDDVNEVKGGYECGISIDGFDSFEVGDQIEAFRTEKVSVVRETA